MTEAPKQISNRVLELDVSGYLMPAIHHLSQPVLVGMPGTDDLFLCLFSTEEKLRTSFADFNIEFEKIVIILDGFEFIESIKEDIARQRRPYELRIAVDPYKVPETGRVRFQEIWIGEN